MRAAAATCRVTYPRRRSRLPLPSIGAWIVPVVVATSLPVVYGSVSRPCARYGGAGRGVRPSATATSLVPPSRVFIPYDAGAGAARKMVLGRDVSQPQLPLPLLPGLRTAPFRRIGRNPFPAGVGSSPAGVGSQALRGEETMPLVDPRPKLYRRSASALKLAGLAFALFAASSVFVGSASAVESALASDAGHASIGERLATTLKEKGIPTEIAVMIISALPVVELRGGIPVARLLGVDPLEAFALCSIGNFIPVVPILMALNTPFIRKILAKPLERAQRKFRGSTGLGNRSLAVSLALFVGIPFPGTGAWTGTMASVALGIPARLAIAANAVGILLAASIMTALTASVEAGIAVMSGT